MKSINRFATAVLSTIILTTAVWGQDSLNVSMVNIFHYWDQVGNVLVDGDYAYLATYDSGLRIIDLSNFPVMEEAGFFISDYDVRYIAKSGNYVYLAEREGLSYYGLRVIDVSDPANPTQTSSLELSDRPQDIFAVGDYVYLALYDTGLVIVDVSVPSSPNITGIYTAGYGASSVYVQDGIAYCGMVLNGFHIINVGNPYIPTQIGHHDGITDVKATAVEGDLAYCACGPYGIYVLDISHPFNPVTVGYYGTQSAEEIAVADGIVYAATDAGLEVLNMRNPGHPAYLGMWETADDAWGMDMVENRVYLACMEFGVNVIDVSNPLHLDRIGLIDNCKSPGDIITSGSYAYMTDYFKGMYVFDLSDPVNPLEIALVPIVGGINEIALQGDYAYLGTDDHGLVIVDISDPETPFITGSWISQYPDVRCLDVEGDYAYMGIYGEGVAVADISDPYNPQLSGYCRFDYSIRGLAAQDGYVYAVDSWDFWTVDATDPTNPFILDSLHTYGDDMDIALQGDYAYIANIFMGLLMVADISNPVHGFLTGEIRGRMHGSNIKLEGNSALLSGSYEGTLFVVDISNPNHPQIVGYYDAFDSFRGADFGPDGYIYAAADMSLRVMEQTGQDIYGEDAVSANTPNGISLLSANPNPFNQKAVITFDLDKSGDVRLEIYDVLGRSVGVIHESPLHGWYPSGQHSVVWDASGLSSGVYLIRLTVDSGQSAVRKAVLLK